MRHDPDAIMLFAAGFGTRMGSLTQTRPKPLINVAGKALLDHALELTTPLNLSKRVVNTHYFSDQVANHLDGTNIEISYEPQILETGGGLKNALPLLGDGPVFTLNTDAVWRGPNPLADLQAAWNPDTMDALLLCVPKSNAVGHTGTGDFIIAEGGTLSRGEGDIYTGAQIIKTDRLHAMARGAFSLHDLWWPMMDAGRMHGLQYHGKWCDVGTPAGISLAEEMLFDV